MNKGKEGKKKTNYSRLLFQSPSPVNTQLLQNPPIKYVSNMVPPLIPTVSSLGLPSFQYPQLAVLSLYPNISSLQNCYVIFLAHKYDHTTPSLNYLKIRKQDKRKKGLMVQIKNKEQDSRCKTNHITTLNVNSPNTPFKRQ